MNDLESLTNNRKHAEESRVRLRKSTQVADYSLGDDARYPINTFELSPESFFSPTIRPSKC